MRAYPRGCGEWRSARWRIRRPKGLPPRVRGMVLVGNQGCKESRLTPAGAGNGDSSKPRCRRTRAYPRGCGEWIHLVRLPCYFLGLPPRVRGMGLRISARLSSCRLTPAGAGNGYVLISRHTRPWAYPRGCGEWRGRPEHRRHMSGLPPRVRGMVLVGVLRRGDVGLTPAGAGLTPAGAGNGPCHRCSRCCRQAYPRGCGEWSRWPWRCWALEGLPPRVRGMDVGYVGISPQNGLTPAGAGNGRWRDDK